ncbi:hypothetical protein P8452_52176 [Trifolium repens]|nr:hypothetical protein P8452_52176 [Trifolium repens]
MDAYMTQIIVDMLDYIEDCRQIVLAPDFDHIDMEEAMQVICLYLGSYVCYMMPRMCSNTLCSYYHIPTVEDLVNLVAQLNEIVDIITSFCERILIPLSVADENDLDLGGEFLLLNIREGIVLDADAAGFLFIYREHAWMPDVGRLRIF